MTVLQQRLENGSEAPVVNRNEHSERRQKPHLIGVRVEEDTYTRWSEAAEARGVTVQELVRACTDHLLAMDETAVTSPAVNDAMKRGQT